MLKKALVLCLIFALVSVLKPLWMKAIISAVSLVGPVGLPLIIFSVFYLAVIIRRKPKTSF